MAIDLIRIGEAPVLGCTNANASNYDPLATLDDGSCTFVSGCTNSLADNYDPLSYLDDGSCTYSCFKRNGYHKKVLPRCQLNNESNLW